MPPGAGYRYRLHLGHGKVLERPDPASRCQPEGVHGPSQFVDPDFDWQDRTWSGLSLNHYIIYELHVGTFCPTGDFDGVMARLDDLVELGVTAVELMPVAQFPGARNWGYDGVYPFAVQNSYGGPIGLKRLVDACHRKGLAVVLDVVYNHLGPEGNYLNDFGPYFTDFYHTPWGEALNFDGPHSDAVRRYFIENALQWIDEFRIDALRLDAVHAIVDFSARPFLEVLAEAVHQRAEALNRHIHLIAESALNDTRVIRPRELGGFNIDAQWNDDFHHSLRTALTDERSGYYQDFNGLADLATAWRDGYVYTGQYSAFRQRAHGNASRGTPARQLVVFAQNHDQIGNRMHGDRLAGTLSLEQLKLAAGVVLLSPFVPLIFMGEEYGETAPFLYFVSHGDPDLVEAVRQGRQAEFADFDWPGQPADPQAEATFSRCRLNHDLARKGHHRTLRDFHRRLLELRRQMPALAHLSKKQMTVACRPGQLVVRRWWHDAQVCLVYHFSAVSETVSVSLPAGRWQRLIDSAQVCWEGPGSQVLDTLESVGLEQPLKLAMAPHSFVLLTRMPPTESG